MSTELKIKIKYERRRTTSGVVWASTASTPYTVQYTVGAISEEPKETAIRTVRYYCTVLDVKDGTSWPPVLLPTVAATLAHYSIVQVRVLGWQPCNTCAPVTMTHKAWLVSVGPCKAKTRAWHGTRAERYVLRCMGIQQAHRHRAPRDLFCHRC